MKVDRFDFSLPEELIAHRPASPRDSARLLYIGERISDKNILDLPDLLQEGDLMIFNNTKVIPARLKGKRGEAGIEINLHKRSEGNIWSAFAKPSKKLKKGSSIIFSDDFFAEVTEKLDGGQVVLKFNLENQDFDIALAKYGLPPLPPYISKKREISEEDKETYQTIYAKYDGAVAAPTAGLHFTDSLFKKLDEKGISKAYVTLHVGGGTFLPVKVDDTDDHKMHSEWCTIPPETIEAIEQTKKKGGRIIAVGTTSLRTLESAANADGTINPYTGETDIFITPGYKFKMVDLLFTNFHLPRSTLFMLVSAFAGEEKMHEAYKHAIDEKYRFYSYGDAGLLERYDQV